MKRFNVENVGGALAVTQAKDGVFVTFEDHSRITDEQLIKLSELADLKQEVFSLNEDIKKYKFVNEGLVIAGKMMAQGYMQGKQVNEELNEVCNGLQKDLNTAYSLIEVGITDITSMAAKIARYKGDVAMYELEGEDFAIWKENMVRSLIEEGYDVNDIKAMAQR